MKKITDIMSPKSWVIFLSGFYFAFLMVFRPSLWELGVYLAVDIVALVTMVMLDLLLFPYLNPRLKYLEDVNQQDFKSLDLVQKKQVFADLAAFPQRRARFAFLLSYLINVPPTLVVLFYWTYDGSIWGQAVKWLVLATIGFLYFYVVVLIELHQFISQKICDLHERFDWSEVFNGEGLKIPDVNLHLISNIGTMTIFLVLFIGQWFVITEDPSSYWDHLLHFFSLGAFCVGLILRIRHLERSLLLEGFERIFNKFSQFNTDKKILALHTLPQIANFDRTFNNLLLKLRQKDDEIGLWMLKELDENRFKVMGEIAGLVIHDLSTPLHVVNFCVTEVLNNGSNLLEDRQFCQHLQSNINHAKGLLQSFDRFLRNPKTREGEQGASLARAHAHAREVITSQFYRHSAIHRIKFEFDPRLEGVHLDIGPADLLHIFYNLYKNAVESLISSKCEDPIIEVSALAVDDQQVVFEVRDNGLGFSAEKFSKLLQLPVSLSNKDFFGKSVGLRLVNNLITRHGGELTVSEEVQGQACFRIKLQPSNSEDFKQRIETSLAEGTTCSRSLEKTF